MRILRRCVLSLGLLLPWWRQGAQGLAERGRTSRSCFPKWSGGALEAEQKVGEPYSDPSAEAYSDSESEGRLRGCLPRFRREATGAESAGASRRSTTVHATARHGAGNVDEDCRGASEPSRTLRQRAAGAGRYLRKRWEERQKAREEAKKAAEEKEKAIQERVAYLQSLGESHGESRQEAFERKCRYLLKVLSSRAGFRPAADSAREFVLRHA